jgi:microsomal epoxide hydrolase
MLAHPRAYGALAKDAFDVVIPSLPGFAFSSASPKLGRGVFETADVWVKLMSHLGYSRFIAQGGDLGAGVSTAIGLKYPDAALGLHLNFIPGSYRPPATSQELDEEENEFLRRRAAWLDLEGAYSHLQATKPESLAPALNDSPVGLLAWITEKFRSWSDCNGELETRISKDELLTTASLYWFSRSMPAAIRVYWEVRQSPLQFRAGDRITVPVGVAEFPRELPMPPRRYVERGFNVVQWTKMPSGGHFAPIEEPAALAEDIRRFASRFRT